MIRERIENVNEYIQVYKARLAELNSRLETQPTALFGSKETGALRRASLDLTRALAELRRPDHVL